MDELSLDYLMKENINGLMKRPKRRGAQLVSSSASLRTYEFAVCPVYSAGDPPIADGSRDIVESLEVIPENAKEGYYGYTYHLIITTMSYLNLFVLTVKISLNQNLWDWIYPVDPDPTAESLAKSLFFNPLCGSVC